MSSLSRKELIDHLNVRLRNSPTSNVLLTIGELRQLLEAAKVGERFRHKIRGTTYEVIGIAKLHYGPGMPHLGDMAPLVIYRADSDGALWARPELEFNDGRFEGMNS